jgi:uncharacterized protein (DUF2235 family)
MTQPTPPKTRKNIVICFDGTWNAPEADGAGGSANTNVVKLYEALDRDTQLCRYLTGVGTKWSERIRGGAFGYGLSAKLAEAYIYLVKNYRPGDFLYFFGFSRGAYLARSLSGLLRICGILRCETTTRDGKSEPLCDKEIQSRVKQAIKLYRSRGPGAVPDSTAAKLFRKEFSLPDTRGRRDESLGEGYRNHRFQNADPSGKDGDSPEIPLIHFLGVWDTVGALGLPFLRHRLLRLIGLDGSFHDVKLSRYVRNARHALAIHDRRSDFSPVLWLQTPDGQASGQSLRQHWFSGVHADVGGGYHEAGLSDIALHWMASEAETMGLRYKSASFLEELGGRVGKNLHVMANPHESFSGLFEKIDRWRGKGTGVERVFRAAIPVGQTARVGGALYEKRQYFNRRDTCEELHGSVLARYDGGLRDFPPSVLAEILSIKMTTATAPVMPETPEQERTS